MVVNVRRLRAHALVAVLVSALVAPAGAAPGTATKSALPDLGAGVSVSRLLDGGTAIVSPQAGAPVAAIELWYRAPSIGFDSKAQPSIARLAAQTVAASKPLVGDPLGTVIANAGGRLAITVYTDSVEISAAVPASQANAIVKAMTTAYFAPVVTDDGFRSAQHDVGQEALFSSFDLETVVRNALFAQLFTDGPQHYPTLGEARDVASMRIDDVRKFATRAFRSANATLVVSGTVDASVAASAVAGRKDPSTDAVPESYAKGTLATDPAPAQKSFVETSGGYGWIGPAIADEREATALDFIADYLFRPDSGAVTKTVAAKFPDAVLVGQFVTLHDPGVLFVAYSGKDRAAVRASVDDGLSSVRKPLASDTFRAALAAFEYHLLGDVQTPTGRADSLGWYSIEGAPDYAPGLGGESGAYFKAAASLTPEFVAATVDKYLAKPPAVVTLAPQAALPEGPR